MASRADRSETIQCDLCDAVVMRRNLSRHRHQTHPTSVVQTTAQRATPLRAVPTAQSTAVPAAASRRASPTSSHPRSDSCESLRSNASTSLALLTMEAARNLLDQHHLTSERDLLQHLHLHFPDIPEDQRRTLIMAAVAGAQRAASTYFMLESNCESQEPEKRQLVRSARNDLSYWNYGQLRILESAIPEPTPWPAAVVDLGSLQTPVDRARSNADMDLLQTAMTDSGILSAPAAQSPHLDEMPRPNSAFDACVFQPPSVSRATTSATSAGDEPYVPQPLSSKAQSSASYCPTDKSSLPASEGCPPRFGAERLDVEIDVEADTAEFDDLTSETGPPAATDTQSAQAKKTQRVSRTDTPKSRSTSFAQASRRTPPRRPQLQERLPVDDRTSSRSPARRFRRRSPSPDWPRHRGPHSTSGGDMTVSRAEFHEFMNFKRAREISSTIRRRK